MTHVATVEQASKPVPPVPPVHPVVELFTSDAARRLIEKFLPEGVDLERVAATVMLAMNNDKTGALKKCTPQSLVLGVARIQQWGLELGTTAHLIPFRTEATPVADYKGLAELMIGSGAIRFIDTKVVYVGDDFVYRLGLDAKLDHIPCAKAKRGPISHAYIILHLPGGRQVFDVMAAEDIDEIRQAHSKQWKDGPLKPWYAKKTLVRQASKLVPKTPRFAEAFSKVLAVMDDERTLELDPSPELPPVAALRASVMSDEDEDRMEFNEFDDRDLEN